MDPDAEWGYTGRFNEMRYKQSRSSAEMGANGPWKDFTLSREFTPTTMVLNADFLTTEDVREGDVFELVDGTDSVFAQLWFHAYVSRNLPKWGVPSL